MNLLVCGCILLQEITEQAFEIFLADPLSGIFSRTAIQLDIPIGLIDRVGPEIIRHIIIVRDALKEQQGHIGEDRIKVEGANAG